MAKSPYTSSGTPQSPNNDAPHEAVRTDSDEKAFASGTKPVEQPADALSALSSQADDPDKVKGAVVDSANLARNTWVLFLSFGTYLVITVGAVTYRQIFLEQQIRLPLLNSELPLVAFFLVAPVLFLIFHVYLLMHLKLMSDKIKYYNSTVRDLKLDKNIERHVRLGLPDFMFVQYLAGPSEGWKSLMHWLLVAITWLTVVIGPLILLLLIQVKFLPYHHRWITWVQRSTIALDICLLWWFCPKILLGNGVGRKYAFEMRTLALILSAATIGFSVCIAVYPGEAIYGKVLPGLTESIFEGPVDEDGSAPWFSNRLVLLNQNFVDAGALEKIIDRKQKEGIQWVTEYIHSFRDRDLVLAVLDNTDLRQVALNGTELQGASLYKAHLQGASLGYANLQGASLNAASLQNAPLNNVNLEGASLDGASLQGAALFGAKLQGASLKEVRLQGAFLDGANLQGAFLDGANLQGASLAGANLQDASLDGANLQGASLDGAKLQDAWLSGAKLWRAYGRPELGNPPPDWNIVPSADALKPEEFTQLTQDALKGVTGDVIKQSIMKALDRLAPKKDVQNGLPDWTKLGKKTSEAKSRKDLADRLASFLTKLACQKEGAPFVTRGLIDSSRVEAVGPHVITTLLFDAQNNTANCPGVKGLDAASIVKLRELASQAKNETLQVGK